LNQYVPWVCTVDINREVGFKPMRATAPGNLLAASIFFLLFERRVMGRMDGDRLPIEDSGCWMGGKRRGREEKAGLGGETGRWLARGRFLRHRGVTT
jgi:hypothetical protein